MLGLVEFEKYAIFALISSVLYFSLGLVEFEKYAILLSTSSSTSCLLGLVEFEKYAILHLLQHLQQQRSQYRAFQKKECFKLKKNRKNTFFCCNEGIWMGCIIRSVFSLGVR